jgi:outer membrane protein OmpA-like peptidoglycan-associated protein
LQSARLLFVRIAAAPRVTLAAIGLITVAVASCSSSSATPASSSSATSANPLVGTCLSGAAAPLTIVVGERSNVPSIQFPDAVESLITTAATDRQPITLIRIDGKPKVFHLEKFSTSDQNSGAISDDINNYVTAVNKLLDGPKMHAAAAQADVLTALSLAAAATPTGGNIIVIDSGLQTVAPLEYQVPGMLMSPPRDVVEFLHARNMIPVLSGRHVLLAGFGYAAVPQPSLDQSERENVAAQWKAIVVAGGGCATVDTSPNTGAELPGLPGVTTVALPTPPTFRNCGTTVLGDAGSVGFKDGLPSFRDPVGARSTLNRLAAALRQGTEQITLIGSTSTEGGDAFNNTLSSKRATAVKAVLVLLGVPGGRIKVVGDGAHYPGRVPDIGPDGQLLLAQAEQDREVIVQLPQCQ